MSEDTFVSFYSEMLIVGEMYRSDSTRYHSQLDSLIGAYKTTEEQVQITIKWYASDNNRWAKIHEKILKRMEARVREYESKH